MTENPQMRYVEAFPVDIEGKQLIYLRDTEGLAPGMAVPNAAYFLLTQMDGSRSVADLQHAFAAQFDGMSVSTEEITDLIGQLDEAYLLNNARFQNRHKEIEAEFPKRFGAPCRPRGDVLS